MAFKKQIPILLVMLAASLLRLWYFDDLPFMYDEFSALLRTHYESFAELVRLGVMENDSHPAGVQIFLYYWVRLVGFNEAWVKLPFAVMGILSVFLVYHIGKLWFSETSALIAASWIAVMQFFVFYSQLARPYAAGLFAVLLLAWIWTLIVQTNKSRRWEWLAFTVFLVFAALMHAFALFMAGLVYLSGFFLINNSKRKPYLLSGIFALVLYSPHIPVFWHQLRDGTIGGWLAAPKVDFAWHFMQYVFHYSWVFLLFSFLVLAFTFSRNGLNFLLSNKYRVLAIAWFMITFATAYLYSLYRSPIIQFSTLYFSFPFVLMALASFARPLSCKYNTLIVMVILIAGSFTLVGDRKHYEQMYKQGFDQIAIETAIDRTVFGDSLLVVVRTARPEMPAFYMDQAGEGHVIYFSKEQLPSEMFALLQQQTDRYPFLAFSWADYASLDWVEVARDFYPYILKEKYWFNTAYYLLSKWPVADAAILLENEQILYVDSDITFENAEIFEQNHIYGSLIEDSASRIFNNKSDLLMISARVTALDTLRRIRLVLEVRHPLSNELMHWQAGALLTDILLPGQSYRLHTTARLPSLDLPEHDFLVRTYLWNQDEARFIKHDHQLKTGRQHPHILGLFEPL
jgi:MFS family permease